MENKLELNEKALKTLIIESMPLLFEEITENKIETYFYLDKSGEPIFVLEY